MASWLLCTRPYKRVSSANSLSVEHMPFPMSFVSVEHMPFPMPFPMSFIFLGLVKR